MLHEYVGLGDPRSALLLVEVAVFEANRFLLGMRANWLLRVSREYGDMIPIYHPYMISSLIPY